MDQILVTGLDGSGKSTIFSALEKKRNLGGFEIIRLPHINSTILENNPTLYKVAQFINDLNHSADQQKNVQLKAVALFASMLFYRKMVEAVSSKNLKRIYCERHPLIDTLVYAAFYAGQSKTNEKPTNNFGLINQRYKAELKFLVELIPDDIQAVKSPKLESLATFIYQFFFLKQHNDFDDLSKLFGAKMPEKIFYLKASPEILIKRLSERVIFEPHETLETLFELNKVYDVVLDKVKQNYPTVLNIIDSNSFESLNLFRQMIESECSKSEKIQ